MPLYDYRCTACEVESEILVRGSATPVCPACGSESLERLPFMAAVRSQSTRDVLRRETTARDRSQARDRINQQAAYERNHD